MRPHPLRIVLILASIACVMPCARLVGAGAPQANDADRAVIKTAETFVDHLAAEDVAAAEQMFDPTMRTDLPADRLRATWTTILLQVGAFKQRLPSRLVVAGTARVAIVPCQFERAALDLQIAVGPGNQVSGFFVRPSATAAAPAAASSTATTTASDLPSYAHPQRYVEQDVTVGSGEWRLPGTLTMPAGAGPFPAVVLVHGSGPSDRDETIGANKPFRDLALGLASRGIAVLRYEKRTREYGAKMAGVPGITVKDETIDDAAAAVMLLAATPRVDAMRIVVLGHSLGAMLVPRIAAEAKGVAGFIVMAGAARPIDQILLDETEYLARLDGTISPDEQKQIDDAKRVVTTIQNLRPEDANGAVMVAGAPASYWLDLRGYNPPEAARAVAQPMLILQGARDYQTTMDDFAKWKQALAGRTNVMFKSYPALNHLFIAGTGPSTPDEYTHAGHVAEDVITDIGAWIAKLPPRKP